MIQQLIQDTRTRFEQYKTSLLFQQHAYNRLRPEWWMIFQKVTDFQQLYQRQSLLYERGSVVWGVLIKANDLLFSPGDSNHPAVILFSHDLFFDGQLSQLQRVAAHLFKLTEQRSLSPELSRFIELISDECSYPQNYPVPKSITLGKEILCTTVMVYRNHLPGRMLSSMWFPLLVSPQETDAALILPSFCWPSQLVKAWLADAI